MAPHSAQDITEFTNLVLESPTVTAVGIKASALAFASSPRKASASFLAARTSSCKPTTRPARSSALTWNFTKLQFKDSSCDKL